MQVVLKLSQEEVKAALNTYITKTQKQRNTSLASYSIGEDGSVDVTADVKVAPTKPRAKKGEGEKKAKKTA